MATQQRRDPWEQQPEETPQAFEAFRIYRDMGRVRSIHKVSRELSKSVPLLKRWSRTHGWVVRAEGWDREQDRLWRAEQADARREAARRHARLASAAQAKIVARLRSINPDTLSPSDLIRWLEVAVRIERDAYAEPERLEVTGPGGGPVQVDVATLTDEERRARLEMLRRELDARLADPGSGP